MIRSTVRWLIANGEIRLAELVGASSEMDPQRRLHPVNAILVRRQGVSRAGGAEGRQPGVGDLADLTSKLDLELQQLSSLLEKITGGAGSYVSE